MALNTALAAQVLDAIIDHEDRYDQQTWVGTARDAVRSNGGVEISREAMLDPNANVCGTTLCVAGWAMILSGWQFLELDIPTFRRRFGARTLREVYWNAPDEDWLESQGESLSSYYRTPSGQFVVSANGRFPGEPTFEAEGARLLGLTSDEGKRVAHALFAGGTSHSNVISALKELSEGRYPKSLMLSGEDNLSYLLRTARTYVESGESRTEELAAQFELRDQDASALTRAAELLGRASRMLDEVTVDVPDVQALSSDMVPMLSHDMWLTGKPRPGQEGATVAEPSYAPF